MLLLSELIKAELWVLSTRIPACRPTGSIIAIQPATRRDTKTTVLRTRLRDEPCIPDFTVQVSGV